MIPKTLSASSLEVAQGCMARWKAEYVDYVPRTGNTSAADVGTAVHNALESFVDITCIKKKGEWELDTLVMYYRHHYAKVFDSSDEKTAEYKDGLKMVREWFKRTEPLNRPGMEVISVEQKRRMPVPTSEGDIPFTYIWDRCDRFEEFGKRIIRIVDYKTIRANLGPEDLRQKLQARIYAVAAAAQFKDEKPDEIWIEFDLLRHRPVSVRFDRADLIETWREMKREAERIIATSYEQPPETLNPGCGWCVRKASCETLNENIKGGGIHSVMGIGPNEEPDIAKVMQLHKDTKARLTGLKNLVEELDSFMLEYARVNDTFTWEAEQNGVKLKTATGSRGYRKISALDVYRILGGELFAAYGKITLKDLDEALEDPSVTDEQRAQIDKAIYVEQGSPSFKVT